MRMLFVCSYCNKQHQAREKAHDCEQLHLDGKIKLIDHRYKEYIEEYEVQFDPSGTPPVS